MNIPIWFWSMYRQCGKVARDPRIIAKMAELGLSLTGNHLTAAAIRKANEAWQSRNRRPEQMR